jgi:hypothetical protein
MVDYLKNRETIQDSREVYDLQRVIAEAARETGASEVRGYKLLPAIDVAHSVLLLSEGTTPLGPDDQAKYLSPDGVSEINGSFHVTAEKIEEVLTQRTIVNPCELILKVKKPDFLGDSMWDFRYEGKKLTAKVIDSRWLQNFHQGSVTIHPGDALEVAAEETVKYGYDQEVLAKHYRVIEVRSVIPRAEAQQ